MILHINTKDKKEVIVSLKHDGGLLHSKKAENEFGSQVLLGLIQNLLYEKNIELSDIKGVEVEVGPGSYTGLRVGASVGQSLAFALGIPINGKLNTPVDLRYA